ncbi:hypothetical protein HK102_002800 [Quaeritorhiza haematococci]|nr:hypothetical protein HK102_002800 [Quaeritorhiza haematococci]
MPSVSGSVSNKGSSSAAWETVQPKRKGTDSSSMQSSATGSPATPLSKTKGKNKNKTGKLADQIATATPVGFSTTESFFAALAKVPPPDANETPKLVEAKPIAPPPTNKKEPADSTAIKSAPEPIKALKPTPQQLATAEALKKRLAGNVTNVTPPNLDNLSQLDVIKLVSFLETLRKQQQILSTVAVEPGDPLKDLSDFLELSISEIKNVGSLMLGVKSFRLFGDEWKGPLQYMPPEAINALSTFLKEYYGSKNSNALATHFVALIKSFVEGQKKALASGSGQYTATTLGHQVLIQLVSRLFPDVLFGSPSHINRQQNQKDAVKPNTTAPIEEILKSYQNLLVWLQFFAFLFDVIPESTSTAPTSSATPSKIVSSSKSALPTGALKSSGDIGLISNIAVTVQTAAVDYLEAVLRGVEQLHTSHRFPKLAPIQFVAFESFIRVFLRNKRILTANPSTELGGNGGAKKKVKKPDVKFFARVVNVYQRVKALTLGLDVESSSPALEDGFTQMQQSIARFLEGHESKQLTQSRQMRTWVFSEEPANVFKTLMQRIGSEVDEDVKREIADILALVVIMHTERSTGATLKSTTKESSVADNTPLSEWATLYESRIIESRWVVQRLIVAGRCGRRNKGAEDDDGSVALWEKVKQNPELLRTTIAQFRSITTRLLQRLRTNKSAKDKEQRGQFRKEVENAESELKVLGKLLPPPKRSFFSTMVITFIWGVVLLFAYTSLKVACDPSSVPAGYQHKEDHKLSTPMCPLLHPWVDGVARGSKLLYEKRIVPLVDDARQRVVESYETYVAPGVASAWPVVEKAQSQVVGKAWDFAVSTLKDAGVVTVDQAGEGTISLAPLPPAVENSLVNARDGYILPAYAELKSNWHTASVYFVYMIIPEIGRGSSEIWDWVRETGAPTARVYAKETKQIVAPYLVHGFQVANETVRWVWSQGQENVVVPLLRVEGVSKALEQLHQGTVWIMREVLEPVGMDVVVDAVGRNVGDAWEMWVKGARWCGDALECAFLLDEEENSKCGEVWEDMKALRDNGFTAVGNAGYLVGDWVREFVGWDEDQELKL